MRHPRVLALIQAGGAGSRMDVLTRERAKPALPFLGSYQLIDFSLYPGPILFFGDGIRGAFIGMRG